MTTRFSSKIPNSVLYIKNGRKGVWWGSARKHNQVHAGWNELTSEVIQNFDIRTIKKQYRQCYRSRARTSDLNALVRLLDRPSQHIWITFEDGYLWWCTVQDRAQVSKHNDPSKGHFWLNCNRPWSNRSIKGQRLAIPDLPGSVTKVAGYRATVAMPGAWKEILRVIQGQADPKTVKTQRARSTYEQMIKSLVQDLSPKDFEHLIDMILLRSGWERVSTLGKTQKDIDLDVENPAIGEHAFVQIKSEAGQAEFNKYLKRFDKTRERYQRMIFAVHSLKGRIEEPNNPAVQVWNGDKIAQLVVRLGLGERLEKMRA